MPTNQSPNAAAWIDVKSLTSSTDPAGGFLVAPEQADTFLDALRPTSVLLASGVPTITIKGQSLIMPRVVADPTARWRGELETLTDGGDPSYGLLRATPKKLCAYVVASRELLEDSSPALTRVLEQQIEQALALGIDAAAFGDAQTVNAAAAPTPLRDISGITTLDMDGSSVAASLGWLFAMLSRYELAYGNLGTAALFMRPESWESVLRISTDGSFGIGNVPLVLVNQRLAVEPTRSILGLPVFVTTAIPGNETTTTESDASGECSSIYLLDTQQLRLVQRQAARVELSPSAHFDQDALAIRATLRADIAALNPATIVRLKGVAKSS
jgi:HK97 family phage major capsid protein